MEFAIFVVIFALILILPACFRAARRHGDEQQQQAAGLSEFRQQQQSQRRAGTTISATTPTPTAPTEEATSESRKELVRKHLYSRKLEHGESVRNLSMLLKAANDRYQDEEKGNVITKSWRSAGASVNKFVGSKPECSICLDAYEANETVCWAKNDDCDHIFHQDCVVAWLQDHDECPLCRTNLLEYDGSEQADELEARDDSMRT